MVSCQLEPVASFEGGRVEERLLSVVIPALNEEDGITDIVERVQGVRESLREVGVQDVEVIVVDDGSDDDTARIVAALPGVRLIRHGSNRGYGAAIKTGFSHARGGLLAFLDADSTYPPEHFSSLCREIILGDADVVVGSRRSGSNSRMPAVRRLGNFFWSTLLSLISHRRVADPASGMRVLRRDALPQLYPLPDGLNFTPVMSTRAVHEGLRLAEIPIPYHERSGRSKLSVIRDGTRFLKTIVWTALEYNPGKVLGLIGLSLFGAAALISLAIVLMRLQGITSLGPWGVFSVYGALILSVGGVSLHSLGLTFNYLVALFHRRPVRQGFFRRDLPGGLSLEPHFAWVGGLAILVGSAIAIASLALGLNGWDLTRLWFWLLGSAMFVLVGLQLVVFWVVVRVLKELARRELNIRNDLGVEEVRRPSKPAAVGDSPPLQAEPGA